MRRPHDPQTDHRTHSFPCQSIKLTPHAAAAHHERWLAHVAGQKVGLIDNGKDVLRRTSDHHRRFKMVQQVGHSRTIRRRKALVMTLTEDSAMAAAAMAGESIQPKAG